MSGSVMVSRLPSNFGVEVHDLDLRAPLTPQQIAELADLMRTWHLLAFRDQQLEAEEQVRVTALFGPPVDETGDGTFASFVSNTRADATVRRNNRLPFHSDLGFAAIPDYGVSLYALEMDHDVATRFADTNLATKDLPEALRSEMEEAEVVNAYNFSPDYFEDHRIRLQDLPADAPDNQYPHGTYPMIDRHPVTGEPFVRVSEMQSSYVVGRREPDSEALLNRVWQHLYSDDHLYEHHWHVGDLLIWDNVVLQHGRREFPASYRRTLRRVALHPLSLADAMPGTALDQRAGQVELPVSKG